MIRIIHISDLHLESEKPSNQKENLILALARDLKTFVNDETLLFFTGDLIDKGAFNFEDKKNAFNFFEEIFIDIILLENPILKGKIFIVPGNHDVFRNKIDEFSEIGIKSKLIDSQSLDNFLIENRLESKHLERLEDYKNWETTFYEKYNTFNATNFENSFILEVSDYNVGITCLNSSWLCKDDLDKDNLLIGKNQIDNSLREIRNCDVKLALSHHPLEFLKEYDNEILKPSIYKNYDILFTGHVHELSSLYTQDLMGNIFISIANSTIGDRPVERKFVNGYTILDLIPNKEITAHYRKYTENHEKFVPNTDIGTEDGKKKFQILKDEKLSIFEENQKIVHTIESRFVEKLNDDIIMSSNNTDVVCSIDNLFVEPTILNNPQGNLSEEETIKYTVDEILESTENFIVFGVKESGKTLLLDKMFLEAIKRFNFFKKIPIILKFSDFKYDDVVRVIREFLSISPKDIEEFLNNNEITLFIDDINFNEKYTEKLENLKKLLVDFPKIHLIATCDLILENVIPTEYLDHNDILNANIAFIQNFSSKEIKQLIQKWHRGKEIDLQDKMEKLIKSFVDFGLPKTPLSVTLFLWIFEKQEKKPINNSVLVELFIENLLEKTNIENIYSETFDFTNKKRLLSFVAQFMFQNGDEDYNYSVDYVDLLKFFKEYLESRFPGQPQKVLGDFIKRGILNYQDENQIKFKSAFFFHYFLSLQFDYEPKFKEYVFTDDNYLSFINEITYYTGLKRDDEGVLNFVQDKLNDAFGDINNDVRENYDKVDKVLESKKETSVTFQIDEEKSNQKLTEKQLEDVFDDTLSRIPVSRTIEKKEINIEKENIEIDKILKLACNVLKNSEDVDSFETKKKAYNTTLLSSISFLMLYRDSLIMYYMKFQKQPENLPKNINFSLFIRVIPLIHQVVIYNWLGTQKLRPVIINKIAEDKNTVNISDYERLLSIYIYSDIRGADYPTIIEEFLKTTKFNYIKDLSFLKIMSYFHLRNNGKKLDDFYLKILANIRQELGYIGKSNKSSFMQKISDEKRRKK